MDGYAYKKTEFKENTAKVYNAGIKKLPKIQKFSSA